MKIKRTDVTYSTVKLQKSKEFYLKYFGFKLAYECDWYVELVNNEETFGVSFTLPQLEEGEFFAGRGIIMSFEVDDVEKEYNWLKNEGVHICQEIQVKPWGEKSFVVDDPNGAHLYIYEQVPKTPEYEAEYKQYQ